MRKYLRNRTNVSAAVIALFMVCVLTYFTASGEQDRALMLALTFSTILMVAMAVAVPTVKPWIDRRRAAG